MEKLIGIVFVGVTLVMAAADGALALLILSAIIGGGTYCFMGGTGTSPGFLSKPHQRIYDREKRRIQDALDKKSDEEKTEIKKVVTHKLETLQRTKDFNEVWDRHVAAAIGLAVFASPIISLGLLGYVFKKVGGKKKALPVVAIPPKKKKEPAMDALHAALHRKLAA